MTKKIKIKKGLDLNLEGSISDLNPAGKVMPSLIAVVPDDFPGLQLKPAVKGGDSVAAGAPILADKNNPEIKVVSPVAGRVKEIVRGERRKVLRVEISPESDETRFRTDSETADLRRLLAGCGLWALLRQLPYGIVPALDDEFRDVFVTMIDSDPLAVDPAVTTASRVADLQAGVEALKLLTKGSVYVGRRPGSVPDLYGAEMVDVEGPHPAGSPSVLAGNINPVNKGEKVLLLDGNLLARIGAAARNGVVDYRTLVAVTGSEVERPCLIETVCGAALSDLLKDNIRHDGIHHRIISGNVLSGKSVGENGFLRYPYCQVTVIPDGDDKVEFMGWASLSPSKMSTSRSFLGGFFKRRYNPDSRLNGGRRAMIMSGEYDSVIPLDIYPEYLIKAILSKDIDKMEQLGIYEVLPEDFALAEMIDTSKLPLQQIVREGLDYIRKETE